MKIKCPKCGELYQVPKSLFDDEFTCDKCHEKFFVEEGFLIGQTKNALFVLIGVPLLLLVIGLILHFCTSGFLWGVLEVIYCLCAVRFQFWIINQVSTFDKEHRESIQYKKEILAGGSFVEVD